MNVILLGYRGCGKTSVGKKLANELWKDFVDTDERVRKRFSGQPIAEIWRQWGEPAFRQAEAEVMAECAAKAGQVIATGGGILTHDAGRQAVQSASNAKRIYLSCSAQVLVQRIAGDVSTTSERPSLTGDTDPAAEVAKVLAERDPIYREAADVVFDVTHCSIEQAVRHLITKL